MDRAERAKLNGLYKQLGEKVEKARTKAGFTQEELANKAGLHRTYIAGIETGRRNISVKSLEKIAKALGIETNNLL
ncbi:MAG: helix-turn-helix transcriptional regulator [Patescibacteria group bacterium]